MSVMSPPPAAATISIRDTLTMLDGPKREIAEGIANGRYVFWLGSGISRDRMPDLRQIAKRVMQELHRLGDHANPACPYHEALKKIVKLTDPSKADLLVIDFAKDPLDWGEVFETI